MLLLLRAHQAAKASCNHSSTKSNLARQQFHGHRKGRTYVEDSGRHSGRTGKLIYHYREAWRMTATVMESGNNVFLAADSSR